MKLPCGVVQDLLPLYTEEMTGSETRELVREHLQTCPECSVVYEKLKEPALMPAEDEAALEKMERSIRRRRINGVLLAVLVTATVLFGGFCYLFGPVYLNVEEAIASVGEKNGVVEIWYSSLVSHVTVTQETEQESGVKHLTLLAARRRWDVLRDYEVSPRAYRVNPDCVVWYASNGSGVEDTLLWGDVSAGRQSLPRLVLGYYLLLALAGGAVCLVFSWLLRRHPAGKLFGAGAIALFCFGAADMVVTGGDWRIYDSFDIPFMLGSIVILTALMTGSILMGIRLVKEK